MRVLSILLLLTAAALGAIALTPRIDAMCLAQKALYFKGEEHQRWNCLHYAAARGDVQAIERLLAEGGDVDARNGAGRTPLAEAAKRGQLEAVRALLSRGAEIDVYDTRSGFTPLHLAAEGNHAAVVRRLLIAGANVDAHNQWNQTPLWQTAWQDWHGNTEVAHVLVAHGAAIDVADDKGHTPLHMAARAGHAPMVDFLLDIGADIERRSDKGLTPLHQAVLGGHADVVRLLLAHGADPNVRANDVSLLELAHREHHGTIVEMLRRARERRKEKG